MNNKEMDKKTKAFVLLSGGLDSMLAVKILQDQKIEVEGISFFSNFYDTQRAEEAANFLGIKLHKIDISKEMLALTKNPPHGHGKNMNPCIDCHGMMFSLAGEYVKKKSGGGFLATGEVLGQRPFSQNKQALLQVQKLAGKSILRPLSAKLLPETEIEKEGLLDRSLLLGIEGRGREEQMLLAKKYGIKEYPSPAGGCLLTDPGFSSRLALLFENWKNCNDSDVELIKNGRVFWLRLRNDIKVLSVVGRHQKDNEKLEQLAEQGDFVVKLKEKNGPTTIARLENKNFTFADFDNEFFVSVPEIRRNIKTRRKCEKIEDLLQVLGKLTAYYATKLRGQKAKVEVRIKDK